GGRVDGLLVLVGRRLVLAVRPVADLLSLGRGGGDTAAGGFQGASQDVGLVGEPLRVDQRGAVGVDLGPGGGDLDVAGLGQRDGHICHCCSSQGSGGGQAAVRPWTVKWPIRLAAARAVTAASGVKPRWYRAVRACSRVAPAARGMSHPVVMV